MGNVELGEVTDTPARLSVKQKAVEKGDRTEAREGQRMGCRGSTTE